LSNKSIANSTFSNMFSFEVIYLGQISLKKWQ
jgi:hypothetical protein